ncbi:hypothetical protein [Anaeromassilibacillus sp. SJQ-1]|uniref:hypothetical protein n=1 Tax=Anaeromassilibacillus sp. SJQ-1 TaxID=3375419 RepID=UPI0039893E0E
MQAVSHTEDAVIVPLMERFQARFPEVKMAEKSGTSRAAVQNPSKPLAGALKMPRWKGRIPMALDGSILEHIKKEIEGLALGARVEKIAQPNREEMVFTLRQTDRSL